MPQRDHIPPLSPNDLEIALQRIDLLAIDSVSKRQLKGMLRAASNPDTNKIETIIKTLPKERQAEIWRIFEDIATMHKKQIDDGNRAVLLLALLSLGTLILSHLLTTDQQALTAKQLLEANKRVWTQAIQDEIDYCGCNARARQASGADLDMLQSMADSDAQSIVATYNRDIQRQLTKLHEQYPNGTKQFFIESMNAWAADRAEWKSLQIASNTEFNVRAYAEARFRSENFKVDSKYIFVGPDPTCEDCAARFAAGVVDLAYTEEWPVPRHLNCPHKYRLLRKPKIDCSTLWVG